MPDKLSFALATTAEEAVAKDWKLVIIEGQV
jgi:hypothetical protein